MDERNVSFLVILLAAVGLVSVFSYQFGYTIGYKDGVEDISLRFENNDFIVLRGVAKLFARNHNYNIKGYNCINYSQDLKTIYRLLGVEANVMARYNNETGHAWLEIDFAFEPQDAQFVDYSKKYPIYDDNLVLVLNGVKK